ncbi:s-adenosyl-l-methionine-dependent methyltransferase [Desulfoluna butyratoxydans]|uniref:DNA (cytosine-5-)-methyltransferase n=2 Tax=Desulfoluna butyratoxydans TaxID=231438 RepID=A0A4V6ILA0_9BACT|nr:s-adenosyl-l-methionine-dependent methyltransferase [Desulfoluna butyratoxydans]
MQYALNFKNEIIVDNFAGGGGASIGIEAGTNRYVDIAINHDRVALDVHALNHPHTRHIRSDVFEVDPVEVCQGHPVGLAWFSPDCRHFSKAKGKAPVSKKIRGLAWVAVKWRRKVRPRIIMLENVEEFQTWGPCIEKKNPQTGQVETRPDPRRKGLTFRTFIKSFERDGYVVEYRMVRGRSYGAGTIRNRFFMIARCDGQPIIWPRETHAPKGLRRRGQKKEKVTAECIDWSIPCPSIFMTPDEASSYRKSTGTSIRRPLADNTLKRIAKGVMKYVIECKKPFIVPIANYGTGGLLAHPVDEPLRTITANPKGGAFSLCTPFVSPYYGPKGGRDVRGQSLAEPLATQTTENRHALITPFISKINHTGNGDKSFRGQGINEALHTITGRNGFSLCTPFISRQFGKSVGSGVESPLGAITSGGGGKSALMAPLIARQFGTGICHSVNTPLNTITAGGGGGKTQLVAASLIQTGYGERKGQTPRALDINKPIGTIVAGGAKHALCSSFLAKHYTGVVGSNLRHPIGTITQADHHSLVNVQLSNEEVERGGLKVAAFLMKYYGQGVGQSLGEPAHTLTTKERLSLVTVFIKGEPWVIVDIGMRMLTPEELMLAQGFPPDYKLGDISKTKKIALIGNSVCPPVAEALVRANYTEAMPWRVSA